jgi:hypothetical protein
VDDMEIYHIKNYLNPQIVGVILFIFLWLGSGFLAMLKYENPLRINRGTKKSQECSHPNKEHSILMILGLFAFIPRVRRKICKSLL